MDLWGNLFVVGFHYTEKFILANDFNFSLGEEERYGAHAHKDSLSD